MQPRQRKVEERWGWGNPEGIRTGLGFMPRAALAVLICGALVLGPSHATAQGDDDGEYRVKLAFLYNFAQFVQWPRDAFRDPAAPLTVCVAGPNPFTGEIEQSLRGRTVGGHPISIKRLKREDDPRSCQMVFVRASEKNVDRGILAALKGSSTLTVGEAKGFAERGGIINLTPERNRLRFEINVNAAAQTRLKISSKLLALARIVDGEQNASKTEGVSRAAWHPDQDPP